MKNFAVLTLFIIPFLLSCKNGNNVKKNNHKSDSSEVFDEYTKLHSIPESLLTPEQRNMLLNLDTLIRQNTIVVDNHMVLTINEEDFIKAGIHKAYYEKVQNEFKANNRYIDSLNLDAKEILKSSGFFKKVK